MTKIFTLIVAFCLLSVSCQKSGSGSNPDSIISGVNSDDVPDTWTGTPVPLEASTFDSNIELVSFTADQEQKYLKAIEIVKLVVATEEFRNKVLNYTYGGHRMFADNRGRTNAQIYQSILDAAETLQPTKNNRMDLEVELYYEASTVVGYTRPSTPRIWVNTKFFNSYTENSVSGNLFHEWLHKLGYTHDAAVTAKRPSSVPYAIGYIMAQIGKKFL
jgi:hypothetical protein